MVVCEKGKKIFAKGSVPRNINTLEQHKDIIEITVN